MTLLDAGKMTSAAVVVVTALYSGGTFIDARFAKTNEVKGLQSSMRLTNLRLEEKILVDRTVAIQHRMWSLEDRYGRDLVTAPPAVKEEYRQMVVDLADIQKQIAALMDAYRAGGYNASDEYYHYERPRR
jgi:hypothetical protein